MDTSVHITAAIFAAYLKCPLKAYLMVQGEKSPDTFFADTHERISAAYKSRADESLRIRSPDVLPIDFLQLMRDPAICRDRVTLFVDCQTASCPCDYQDSLGDSRRARKSEPGHNYVPIRYSACDKTDQSDGLLVGFGALAIALVRNDTVIGRSIEKTVTPVKKVIVDKEVHVNKPGLCLRCGSSKLWTAGNVTRVVFDLKFMRNGIKRWTIRYHYKRYQCSACGAGMMNYAIGLKYGPNLHAYVTYLLIEMRLSLRQIAEHLTGTFNVPIAKGMVSDMKSTVARKYEPTYRRILEQIASGPLVQVDETKGAVRGGGHYVWIFANLTSAAYVYSATREASILGDVLARFKGVLVSDFYTGYDAVPCRQQKCLIHLMRDINEDVLKHPFNEELTFIATRFGALLREIVETIDRYGLKKRHLRKHKRTAERSA